MDSQRPENPGIIDFMGIYLTQIFMKIIGKNCKKFSSFRQKTVQSSIKLVLLLMKA
jgi:hypothetical protein